MRVALCASSLGNAAVLDCRWLYPLMRRTPQRRKVLSSRFPRNRGLLQKVPALERAQHLRVPL